MTTTEKPELNLCEMFASFDGEVNSLGQGTPSVFVRLQGCNLRCTWCDTPYAQSYAPLNMVSIDKLIEEVVKVPGIKKVTITGGEPVRLGLKTLVKDLFFLGYYITVETNGSALWHLVDNFPYFFVHCWVVDYKLPSSGQMEHMQSLDYYASNLKSSDFVKFVVDTLHDFEQAVEIQKQLIAKKCVARYAYSTTNRYVLHADLAEIMLETPEILEKGVLNCQLHKWIWPDQTRR